MPFAEFSRKRIFEPLGLTDTPWRDDYRRIVVGRSSAYSAEEDGGFAINRPIEDVHGNGGILTTVGDLQTWNRALTDGRLGGPEFLQMMHDRGTLNDGRNITYASGLRVSSFAGVPSVTHTGSTAGYRAFVGRYPDQELSVALLCNVTNANPGSLGGQVARAFLGEAARADAAEPAGIDLPASELRSKAGLYRETATGDPLRITFSSGELRIGREALIPVSDTEFQLGASERRFTFSASSNGARPTIDESSGGYHDGAYVPVEDFAPRAAQLRPYAGTFHSYDAETTLVLAVEEGRLVACRRPDALFELTPVYPDAFDTEGLGLIRFHRGADGRVVELGIRQGRVYDMRFQRVSVPATDARPQ